MDKSCKKKHTSFKFMMQQTLSDNYLIFFLISDNLKCAENTENRVC